MIDPKMLRSSEDLRLLGAVKRSEKKFLERRHGRGEDLESAVKIFLEFLHGFESMSVDRPCVTVFGSARTPEDHPHYQLARSLGRKLAEDGFAALQLRLSGRFSVPGDARDDRSCADGTQGLVAAQGLVAHQFLGTMGLGHTGFHALPSDIRQIVDVEESSEAGILIDGH